MGLTTAEQLRKEIHQLEQELQDRKDALPAHSVQPHQLLIIEELEEEIDKKKWMLTELTK